MILLIILGKISMSCLFKDYQFYCYLWNKNLRWLMSAKFIPANGTKDLLFPVQKLKVVNNYIAYLHTE